jgi:hypothetical protein
LKRLWIALSAFAVLAFLAWQTLGDERIRLVTLVILGGFALRTLAHRHDAALGTAVDRSSSEGAKD